MFYLCGQIARMLLLAVQYNLLPKKARKHGLRTLIRDVMRTVARLVTLAGSKLRLNHPKSNLKLDWLCHMAVQLE